MWGQAFGSGSCCWETLVPCEAALRGEQCWGWWQRRGARCLGATRRSAGTLTRGK